MNYSTDPSHRMEHLAPPPAPSRSASPTPRPTSASTSTSEPPVRKGNSKTRRNKQKSSQNRAAERRKQREEGRGDPYSIRTSSFLNHVAPRRTHPAPNSTSTPFLLPLRGTWPLQMSTQATPVMRVSSFASTGAVYSLGWHVSISFTRFTASANTGSQHHNSHHGLRGSHHSCAGG